MKQIDEGPAKEKSRSLAVIQDDKGFNWNKYIPNEGSVLVAEIEVRYAERWDDGRQCFLDAEGNNVTNPNTIDFEAVVKTIPTIEVEYKEVFERLRREKERRENPDKFVKEIIIVNQEMTAENLMKMADKAMMTKITEVDNKTKSESSK
ncbi:hypothetical protein Hanom_Chr11g01042841 [Helianthus anomalus]